MGEVSTREKQDVNEAFSISCLVPALPQLFYFRSSDTSFNYSFHSFLLFSTTNRNCYKRIERNYLYNIEDCARALRNRDRWYLSNRNYQIRESIKFEKQRVKKSVYQSEWKLLLLVRDVRRPVK